MKRPISACLLIFTFAILVSGQDKSVAAAKWETYVDQQVAFSISLPKMPTRFFDSDACTATDSARYFVYSEDIVYKIEILRKGKAKPPSWCTSKSIFDADAYFDEVVATRDARVETLVNQLPRARFVDKTASVLVIKDEKNHRLIELSMIGREQAPPEEPRFFGSFSADKGSEPSVDIGRGAEQILGDVPPLKDPAPTPVGAGKVAVSQPYQVVYQPRARYTDEARNQDTEGPVRLKITLLASGTIGTVTVVTALPNGLTEQAIKAARSIVFFPKRVNGTNVSVIVTREYTFTIY